MNGWDVLSDAIKIGVPSLLTGVIAIKIARATRSHELEKERRRRKQDFLEHAGDLLDELLFRLAILQGSSEYANLSNRQLASTIQYYKDKESCEAVSRAFNNLRSRFLFLGFERCITEYAALLHRMNEVLGEFYEWENGKLPAVKLLGILGQFEAHADKFRVTLAAAYQSL